MAGTGVRRRMQRPALPSRFVYTWRRHWRRFASGARSLVSALIVLAAIGAVLYLKRPQEFSALVPVKGSTGTNTIAGTASVIDGDTIEIRGQRIRLFGIDAPEHDQTCTDARGADYRCGQKASLALDDLIKYRLAHCESVGTDNYGRVLAVCHVAGKDVNGEMVKSGWAVAYEHYSVRYVPEEWQARSAKAGMWAGSFEMPWDFRHKR